MAKKTDDKSIEETEADQSGGDGAGSFFQRWSNRKSSARSTEEEEAAEALAQKHSKNLRFLKPEAQKH